MITCDAGRRERRGHDQISGPGGPLLLLLPEVHILNAAAQGTGALGPSQSAPRALQGKMCVIINACRNLSGLVLGRWWCPHGVPMASLWCPMVSSPRRPHCSQACKTRIPRREGGSTLVGHMIF
jgi:hypothetical protein